MPNFATTTDNNRRFMTFVGRLYNAAVSHRQFLKSQQGNNFVGCLSTRFPQGSITRSLLSSSPLAFSVSKSQSLCRQQLQLCQHQKQQPRSGSRATFSFLKPRQIHPLQSARFSTSCQSFAGKYILDPFRKQRKKQRKLQNAAEALQNQALFNFLPETVPISTTTTTQFPSLAFTVMPTNKDRPKSLADHTATAAAVARENLIQDQYSSWSRTALLNRVRELEDAAKNEGKVVPEAKNPYYFDPIYSPTPFAAESSTSSGGNTSTLANQSFNNNQRQQRGQGSGSKALTVIAINNGTATSSTASPITTSGPGSEVGGESSAVESPRIYTTIETPKKKERRPFDFSKYAKRHIAFKIAYFGWDYNGFAAQGSNVDLKTIEAQIFNAFVAARFIEDPDECNYSRCGRTDRGVSGLGQVIALTVRSSLPKDSPFVLREEGDGYVEPEATTDGHERTQEETMEEYEKRAGVFIKKGIKRHKDGSVYGELPYLNVINRLLPPDIRVVAWAPVAPTFDARFDCKWRQYKYFFPKGQIDIEKMKVAANKFLGTHDFRNFCKFDSSKSYVNYERTIHAISIDPIEDHTFAGSTRLDGTKVVGFGDSSRQFYEMTLTGSAFLWHQVRCMMSVLLTVGQGLESVDIVDELMDLTKYPAKPNYDMAADLPLVLYDCHFENLEWQYQTETDLVHDITPLRLYRGMEDAWSCHVIKSLMYSRLVLALDNAVLMNLPKKGDRTLLGPYAVENVANEKNISLGADLRMFMGKRYASMSDRKKCLPTDEKTKRHNERKRQRLALLTASEENSPSPSQGGEDTPMAEPDSPSTPTAEASSSSATTEVQQRTEAVVVPAKQA